MLAVSLLVAGCADSVSPDTGRPTMASLTADQATDTIRIAGTGSIGTVPEAPGNDVRDFDLDVASTLTGRLFYRDWYVVRPDGSVGTLTVDPTDTATRITAFRDGSTACADPTTGVEFDGIGRVNTGGDSNPDADEFLNFSVWACDGGPAGNGADYLAMIVPAHDYARGDLLDSGDLVKSRSSPAVTTHLAFTVQPGTVVAGSVMSPPVSVTAQDDAGNTATAFTGTVSVAIGANPGGGTLSGTTSVAAVSGVATFSDLSIDQPGNGYTLTATTDGLAGATSTTFNVKRPHGRGF